MLLLQLLLLQLQLQQQLLLLLRKHLRSARQIVRWLLRDGDLGPACAGRKMKGLLRLLIQLRRQLLHRWQR